jgi:hypothetical protein
MMISKKAVTPAQAGVQDFCNAFNYWIPACAGMTGIQLRGPFCEFIK